MTIQYKSIKELNEMLNNKDISPTELLDETFQLIDEHKDLNAFVTLNKEGSYKAAKELDSKDAFSSLEGIPIAQKELFCTKDILTTCG